MTTAATMQAKALYANTADTDEELSFAVGDVLTVHERDVAGLVGWWLCSLAGRIGIAPGNRLRLLTSSAGGAVVPGDQQQATKDSPTTMKPRPATASQRGHTAQTTNGVSTNKVSVRVDILLCLALTNSRITWSLLALTAQSQRWWNTKYAKRRLSRTATTTLFTVGMSVIVMELLQPLRLINASSQRS